jgi:hypothetical protein
MQSADTGQKPLEIVVGEAGSGLTQGNRNWYQPAVEIDPDNEPPAFPGVLATVTQLRMLLDGREEAFAEISARGSTVHLPTGDFANVLLTRHASQICRWYFRDNEAWPFGVDVQYANGVDECRMVFADWISQGDLPLPNRIGLVRPDSETIEWLGLTDSAFREIKTAAASQQRPSGEPAQ